MRKKREDKLCKGDYKYTPFAKSVLVLQTENRRKFSPLAVCLFSAIFSSFCLYKEKSPTEWPRIYFSIRLNYLRSLALMRTTFPSRTTTNSPSYFLVFSIRRFRASKIPALIFSCICFISISLIVCNCFPCTVTTRYDI